MKSPERAPAGWFADPLGPSGALRCWDGAAWTARVVPPDAGGESLSWRPDLADLAAPDPAPPSEAPLPVLRVELLDELPSPFDPEPAAPPMPLAEVHDLAAVAPSSSESSPPAADAEPALADAVMAAAAPQPPAAPAPDLPASFDAADPLSAAFGDEAEWPPEADVERAAPGSLRRRLVAVVAAAAVVALAAGGGAAIFGDGGRPELEKATFYSDTKAGFSLRAPDAWKVDSTKPGESIRYTVSAPGAPPTLTNTVSVVVGPESAALPALDELANEVTNRLREQFSGIRLENATLTTLMGAPALRLQLADVNQSPPLRIQQLVGRTTTGRPLSVTATVREPRTAPTPQQLDSFIDSISPA